MTTGSFCLNLALYSLSFRFKGFCLSSMLISLSLTTFRNFLHRKKQQNQIAVGTERPSSVAIVDLPFNVVSENDQMISFKTVVIFSSVLISFFMIWSVHYSSIASRDVYYNLMICFSLVLNVTPPLYFFNNLSSFKIAVSLVGEMFN